MGINKNDNNTVNTEIDNGHAAIGGALIDCLYLHHVRLAEVFRYFDKDNRLEILLYYVYIVIVIVIVIVIIIIIVTLYFVLNCVI